MASKSISRAAVAFALEARAKLSLSRRGSRHGSSASRPTTFGPVWMVRHDVFKPNPGHLPDEADGCDEGRTYRVHVRLRNGYTTVGTEPQGWPATGRGECNWRLTGSPFDILEWEIVG